MVLTGGAVSVLSPEGAGAGVQPEGAGDEEGAAEVALQQHQVVTIRLNSKGERCVLCFFFPHPVDASDGLVALGAGRADAAHAGVGEVRHAGIAHGWKDG